MSVEGWEKKAIQYLASDVHHSFIDGDWIEAPYIINEGIRLIQTGNIGVGKFIDRNKKYISESSFVELRCKEVYSGDILICRLADPIGRSCIVPPLEEKAITSVDICILRIDKQRYDKWFISHSLNQQSFLDICQKVAGGSTRQRISRSNLGKIEIDIPQSKAEQTQIATILSTIDRAIEQTEALITKQQRIKTGLMQDLLTKGIDENGNIRSEETHEFKDSPLGRIPVEWEVKSLQECVEFWDGKRVPLKQSDRDLMQGEIPYYGASGIIDYIDKYIFDEDLILVGEDGENVVSRRLPLCFKITGKSWVNNHAHVLKPVFNANIDFLTERLEFFDYTLLISGSAQPKLNQRNLRNLSFSIPPLSEQKMIASLITNQNRSIKEYETEKEKLMRKKTGLMQDLLTGKVRVTDLLNQNTATN
ncbi:restriction endonuclease subunit S [Microcystis aeruginosa]|uniref:Type I restriction modification DNA specificity domain-containing protein n=1 Tax=Microcystis aeruginosa NIES-4285 TaxID=2497681 RepID=A0A402DFZ0_MICAE|nr:restriction endonuclease subunit S [Microcystis aeruginosa]GCE61139.1 hypothetical protein MiAbB_03071 [Microcystis aeruginosa NIES-4285]